MLQLQWAARLPEHDITGVLRELVVTVHVIGHGSGPSAGIERSGVRWRACCAATTRTGQRPSGC
ncbi:hypothetical protein ACIQVK_19340 [Streptomyces sp. NPDC090493]|uniref:hypothetical protein n=1 Tax=Streptomyces sp. NPDC090493 TaxID=3365964 RepID=UPI00382607A3